MHGKLIELNIYNGLSAAEVNERIASGKVNSVKAKTSRSLLAILRANVFTLFNAILISLTILVLLTGQYADALFGIVIIVNSIIGIIIELRAKLTLDRLSVLKISKQHVIREGAEIEISFRDIVLGDILVLRSGDQVTVDCEILESSSLKVDESQLTGEADEVSKSAGDAVNSGSYITYGQGIAKAIAVGEDSFTNQIQSNVKQFSLAKSELQQSINKILKWISFVIVPLGALLFITQSYELDAWGTGWMDDNLWKTAVILTASGIVGMIPEGLVLLTSMNFAISSIQLARQNVLVEDMPSVEILARTNVLAFDKTGTLTTGKIEFTDFIQLTDSDTSQFLFTLVSQPGSNQTAQAIASGLEHTVIASGEAARQSSNEGGGTKSRFVREHSESQDLIEADYIPFDSVNKTSSIKITGTLYELGAPEMILKSLPNKSVESQAARLAEEGNRILLFRNESEILGIVCLREQIRIDARETIKFFIEQGIKPIVISGDSAKSISVISKAVGIDGEVCDLSQSDSIPDDVSKFSAFARSTPNQKVEIVKQLQASGNVVAIVGDGVNDAMAIKQADIGIAQMNATDVTKSVAKVVLLDGQFSKLPLVLGQGRRVMANMERVASLFLVKTAYSMILAILTIAFTTGFVFLPRHLTFVSALTIGIPAFLLSLPKNNTKYEPGFLKRVLKFSLPWGISIGIAIFAAYYLFGGLMPAVTARSAAVMLLLILTFIVLAIKARPIKGWRLIMLISIAAIALLGFLIPFTAQFFQIGIL